MADRFYVEIDESALKHAVNHADGVKGVLEAKTAEITGRANAMGAGFRTGRFYDRAERKLKGNTQPEYAGDVRRTGQGYVGLVHPKNYAAMKDTHLHNTLLKARG